MIGLELIKLLFLSMISTFCYCSYVKIFKGFGQSERKEGLRSHQNKNGTITMGGIIFLILPLLFIPYTSENILIIITVVSFGLLGLIDDIFIVIFKKNDGLSPKIKLLIEVLISGVIFYLYLQQDKTTVLDFGFISIQLKWLFGIFILWLLTASTNAWNLLDGVDGLCSGCSLIIGIGLMIISLKKNEFNIFILLLIYSIVIFIFWCFNLPKAFLFMGNVGSLALGALYSIVSVYLNCILSFVIMSALFIFDTLSVIIQVSYYKKYKKRIFKMAPFHHHLEACGFKEITIDLFFYGIQIILVGIGVICC